MFVVILGCSKCLKVFNKVGDFTDYSGSDVDAWELRTGINHKRYALHAANANTKSECEKRQREHGARYSELHRLPYYDPVRMHTIDPMHNLYLGTAKHVFKTWIEIGVLTSDKLECIDNKMKKVKVPTDVGRIPGLLHLLVIYIQTFFIYIQNLFLFRSSLLLHLNISDVLYIL